MATDNFTLTTIYTSWQEYQAHIKNALSSLTPDQLELRPAPHLRSIGELALHIIGCRVFWFSEFLRENGGEEMRIYESWNEAALSPKPSIPTPAELTRGLDHTWQFMMDCLTRWSPDDMQQTFPDDWDGQQVNLSRAWVVWHVLEHDLHHGGELSLTLGMHGIPAQFPG